MRAKPQRFLFSLDETNRAALEKLSNDWGTTMSGALNRLIREASNPAPITEISKETELAIARAIETAIARLRPPS